MTIFDDESYRERDMLRHILTFDCLVGAAGVYATSVLGISWVAPNVCIVCKGLLRSFSVFYVYMYHTYIKYYK